MNILKFIKHYIKMKKVINELKNKKRISEVMYKKLDDSLKTYNGTIAPYQRKKLSYYKGKIDAYENSLLIIEKFINTGELLNIEDETNFEIT
jgi:hypothetical protein